MQYNMLGEYLKQRFGCKVYRLSIPGGYSCPNRDGTCGTGGCIFCAEGSGSFSAVGSDINEQLDNAKRLVEKKCKSGKYIAYFQSFTATYMPADLLFARLDAAIKRDDIVAVSVATRPDCLDDSILAVLSGAAKIKPLFVELGLQTASPDTAKLINRGYGTDVYFDACRRLHTIGAEVVTHVMLGLPGETEEDVLATVDAVNNSADGIKLQLTHVLKGTRLGEMYMDGCYTPLAFEKYIDLLCTCVRHLDPNIVIHRLTGDGDKRLLVAPEWSADKKRVLNHVNAEFTRRNVTQGIDLTRTI